TQGNNWPVMLQIRNGAITLQSDFFNNQNQPACHVVDDEVSSRAPKNPDCSRAVVAEATAVIDRIALSPTGSAAALFSSSDGRIYVFTNLYQRVSAAGQVNVSGLGSVTAIAVSDDGSTVAIGVSDGQTGSLFVAGTGTQPRMVASLSHPAAIT